MSDGDQAVHGNGPRDAVLRLVAAACCAVVLCFMPCTARAAVPAADHPDDVAGVGKTKEKPDEYGSEVFWMEAAPSYGIVQLETLEASQSGNFTADVLASSFHGPGAQVGLGARLSILTVGLRGSVFDLSGTRQDGVEQDMTLWTCDLELAFHVPLGRAQPFFLVGGGYTMLGGLGDAIGQLDDGIGASGANARAGLGLAYYLTHTLSIEARGTAELLLLNSRGASLTELAQPRSVETIGEAKARAREADGTSIGGVYALTIGPGLNF